MCLSSDAMKCLFSGVALRYNVLNAAKPLLFNPPFYVQNKNILLRFPIFLSVSFSLCFNFSPLVSALFVSVFSLTQMLSLSLCSVKHGQRTAAEQPWWVRCRATGKHLINFPSLWLYFSSCDSQTQPFVSFTLFTLNTFIVPRTAQITISVYAHFFFATQTLNVSAGSQFLHTRVCLVTKY